MEKGTAIKDLLNADRVRDVARLLEPAAPGFDGGTFVARATDGLEALEFKGRVLHLVDALHEHLSDDFPRTARAFLRALQLADEAGWEPSALAVWPLCEYVGLHGTDHPDEALAALYELTRRMSAEFAIRPLLERHPERTLAALREWVSDPDPRVRRLVSEGTRPRLPWAARLRVFEDDPAPVLALLEQLRDDPDEVVRRSVANHLNDLTKEHPRQIVELLAGWAEGAPEPREKLIRHALRTLVKKGDPGALAVLGYGEARVAVEELRTTPARVELGETVTFTARLRSEAEAEQRLLIDYAVHYVKARGKRSPKVFKGREAVLPPGETLTFERRIQLVDMSTRRHYPGEHFVELLVNGSSIGTVRFELVIRVGRRLR